jgi:hypothetical protein
MNTLGLLVCPRRNQQRIPILTSGINSQTNERIIRLNKSKDSTQIVMDFVILLALPLFYYQIGRNSPIKKIKTSKNP